ncbi:MAG: hypothetical protein SFV18_12870 [Bryobacteraceae bacterium]|nr:hypothetical protein [Bryobacteraceae bacterium]
MIRYVTLTLALIFQVRAEIRADIVNPPGAILQFVSLTQSDPQTQVPPTPGVQTVRFDVNLKNTSTKGTMAYSIRYDFADSKGEKLQHTCFHSHSFNAALPMIEGGGVKSLTLQTTVLLQAAVIRPVVDLLLLSDGTYSGEDSCHRLEIYQQALEAVRVHQAGILRRLEKDGPEKTIAYLKEQVAQRDTTDRLLMNPKKLPN